MKTSQRWKLWCAACAALLIVGSGGAAFAATLDAGESLSITPETGIEGNGYFAGSHIGVMADAPADLFMVAGTALSGGAVGGDLLVLAGTGESRGPVAGDARLIGGDVTAGDRIGGELLAVGGSVHVLADAVLVGESHVIADRAVIDGVAEQGLTIRARTIEINGTVRGPLSVTFAEALVVSDTARIEGPFTYRAPKAAMISAKAVVAQEPVHERVDIASLGTADGAIDAFVESMRAAQFLGMLFAGFMLAWLFPHFVERAVRYALWNAARAAAIGAAVVAGGLVTSAALLITVIGAYAGVMLLALGLGYILLSKLVAGAVAGALLAQWVRKEPLVSPLFTVLGVISMWVIGYVPVLGALANILLFFTSAGSIAAGMYVWWWRPRNSPLPPITR